MSYSRWSNSVWYVWWDSSSGQTKDEQVVAFGHRGSEKDWAYITYKDLMDDRKKCLVRIQRYYTQDVPSVAVDLPELDVKLDKFIEHMNEEFDNSSGAKEDI